MTNKLVMVLVAQFTANNIPLYEKALLAVPNDVRALAQELLGAIHCVGAKPSTRTSQRQ